ncbi:hypothetical protein Tco_1380419 [Tanacetum coccineum]
MDEEEVNKLNDLNKDIIEEVTSKISCDAVMEKVADLDTVMEEVTVDSSGISCDSTGISCDSSVITTSGSTTSGKTSSVSDSSSLSDSTTCKSTAGIKRRWLLRFPARVAVFPARFFVFPTRVVVIPVERMKPLDGD